MRRMFTVHRLLATLAVAALAVPAAAQVQSRPTDPPLVTALNELWYQLREPVQFAGELYYPAGATVFFNGNVMVRTGHYNGIPLYADTTVEPFSIVLVPIGRGQMQPYERPRRGDLAGTTGSRAPSFPVRPTPELVQAPMAAAAPTAPPVPIGAVGVHTPERRSTWVAPARPVGGSDNSAPLTNAVGTVVVGRTGAVGATGVVGRTGAVGTTGTMAAPRPPAAASMVSMRRADNNDGVWIEFGGERWVSAGTAMPLVAAEFVRVGEYAGFPVFARRELTQEVIYLPTREGFIAPYRMKD